MTGQPLSPGSPNARKSGGFHRMMVEVHGPETPASSRLRLRDLSTYCRIGAAMLAHLRDSGGISRRPATLFDRPEAFALARRGEGGPLPGVACAPAMSSRPFPTAATPISASRHARFRRWTIAADSPQYPPRHGSGGRVLVLKAAGIATRRRSGTMARTPMMLLANGRERSLDDLCAALRRRGPAPGGARAGAASGDDGHRGRCRSSAARLMRVLTEVFSSSGARR